MPELNYRIVLIRQQLAASRQICSSITHPLIARAIGRDGNAKAIVDQLELLVEKTAADNFHQITLPRELHKDEITLRIDPPHDQLGWDSEFNLPISYVWWEPEKQLRVAYVPSIGIHAIAVGAGKIENEVRRESRQALIRCGATKDLKVLAELAQYQDIQLESHARLIDYPTPKEVAQKTSEKESEFEQLEKVAIRLHSSTARRAYQLAPQVKTLSERLSGKHPQSVLLVGPSGCGKTALFSEMVREHRAHKMEDFLFWQTDGSRLIAGMSGFGQWQDRCSKIVAELSKQKAVIHLGNLVELIEVGRGGSTSHGIADFLRPFIQRGKILAVAECTTEQRNLIEIHAPQLLDAFHLQMMESMGVTKTGEVLLELATHEFKSTDTQIEPSAISAANQLHARYATYSAMPGRAIRFFRNLAEDNSRKATIIDDEVVTAAFSKETGLPLFLLSDRQQLDLDSAHEWFSKKVIGQPEPVDLVVDLLAAIKTNLTRPGRPIASLLFVGPTGVGKTEMAKSIAEYMYRDPTKMVRFDMSEYSHALAVDRLIGGFGTEEGLLTGKIKENPFTVLLFDEFEKAHPAVFDLLLQVLGEGRLTDGRGRLTDFSTTIIVMTSNLGVDSFRTAGIGFTGANEESYRDHFIRKVQDHVRPEFFNRIDRIVPFTPLAPEAVHAITKLQLDLVRQRDGIEGRQLDLRIHQSVIDYLAKIGFDPKYGARPIKRAINQCVVGPLSKKLNRFRNDRLAKVNLHAQKTGIHFQVNFVDQPDGKKIESSPQELWKRLGDLSKQRRRAQALAVSPVANRIRNQLYRLQQQLDEKLKRLPKKERASSLYSDHRLLTMQQEIERLTQLNDKIELVLSSVVEPEHAFVAKMYGPRNDKGLPLIEASEVDALKMKTAQQIDELLLELFLADTKSTDRVNLFMFSKNWQRIRFLAQTYEQISKEREFKTASFVLYKFNDRRKDQVYRLLPPAKEDEQYRNPTADVVRVVDLQNENEYEKKQLIGAAITFSGSTCYQMMSPERGVHIFQDKSRDTVLVQTTGQDIQDFEVPEDTAKLSSFDLFDKRRTFNYERNVITDTLLDKTFSVRDQQWSQQLREIINVSFRKHLDSLIESWN